MDPGAEYTVTEETNSLYTTTANGSVDTTCSGTINADQNNSAVFVNTFKTGDLTIQKIMADPGAPSRLFTMELSLGPGDLADQWSSIKELLDPGYMGRELGTTVEKTYEDGDVVVFRFSLAAGPVYRLRDLPAGLSYKLLEVTTPGFEPEYGNNVGKIDGVQPVTVTNTFKTGSLTIKKEMLGDGNAYRAFPINVILPSDDATVSAIGSYTATYKDKEGVKRTAVLPCTDGKIRVSLLAGQSVTISGLPMGVSYVVKEDAVTDYSASYEVGGISTNDQAAGTISEEDQTVIVTNSYKAGTLVVKKVVTGDAADMSKEFRFTVTLSDDSIDGNRGDVTFVDGVATFTLGNNGVKNIPGLKSGLGFTVTEDDANLDGYVTTYAITGGTAGSEPATGRIEENGTIEVTVTNTKAGGGPGGGGPGGGGPGGGGPGGGGGVSPPVTWPTATPSASPSPSPSAGPTPTPGGTPGPGQTSQPFGTPQPTRKPGTTSQPFTPGTGSGTGGSGSGSGGPTAPATGDETAIAPWAILLALSAAGLAAVLTAGRRRRRRG